MKVLGVSGSMRKNGNTSILVRKILENIDKGGCEEVKTEFISLSGKEIKPCTGCGKCRETKWCTISNDDWSEVAEKVVGCDVLILGSPTYYYDICGHLKNFLDRTYSLYHDRKLAGRNAIVVSVCAERGCDRTLESLEGFVNTHEFYYLGYVGGKGVDEGDILNDERAIKKCAEVAEKVHKLLSNTRSGSYNR